MSDSEGVSSKYRSSALKKTSPLKLLSQSQPNFALLSKWFHKRRFLWEFPIVSHVKLSSAVAAILVEVLKCWTQFWKRTTQESMVLFQKYVRRFGPLTKMAPTAELSLT
jgi:hypothetical protein